MDSLLELFYMDSNAWVEIAINQARSALSVYRLSDMPRQFL